MGGEVREEFPVEQATGRGAGRKRCQQEAGLDNGSPEKARTPVFPKCVGRVRGWEWVGLVGRWLRMVKLV